LNHGIVFDDAVGPFEVLLRLETEGNHSIHVEALRWDDAYSRVTRDSILITSYLIFTLMVITWAVVTVFGQRSKVLLLFVAHQFSALSVVLTLFGVWRMFAPDDLVHLGSRLASFFIPLSVLVSVWFHARLLADLGARATHTKIIGISAALPVLGMLLIAAGFPQIGLMLSHATIAAVMPFSVFVALRLRADAGRWWWRPSIAAAYLVMSILMAPAWLRVLGLLPGGAWTFFSPLVYAVVSAILMAALIVVRARELRRLGRQNEAAFLAAKREADLQRARAAEQSDLITMLTHELKTPLSVVSLALGKSGQQPTIRARALNAMENMRSVIDRCAQAARLDDDTTNRSISLNIELVELRAVVKEAVAGHLQGDRVEIQLHTPLPACWTDRASILTIISNLLDNALKYSPSDSVVRIEAQIPNLNSLSGVTLQITNSIGDQGAPDPDRIFEKYYRGPRARNLSGTGLGLYLSRRLAQRVGGELSLASTAPTIVGFELWLPNSDESAQRSGGIPQPHQSTSRSTQS
jgi:signal transduction histidine kinase